MTDKYKVLYIRTVKDLQAKKKKIEQEVTRYQVEMVEKRRKRQNRR